MELCVYEDCMSLLQNFVKSNDFRFQCFSAQWRQLSFSHIWSAQNTYIEVIQTTSAALHVAKRMACGKRTNGQPMNMSQEHIKLGYRIGGIYLMYAVYFKQPTSGFVAIEVSQDTWQTLSEFMDVLSKDNSNKAVAEEVCYIFQELFKAGAFSFTAHDFPLGIESLINYDKPPTKIAQATSSQPSLEDDLPIIKNTAATLPALAELEQHYNKMKKQLSYANGGNMQALPATSIVKELQDAFHKIAQALGDVHSDNDRVTNGTVETESTRRNIKRKAFANEVEKDDVQNDEDESVTIDRRQSARTVFARQLPNEISEEVDEDVSDSDSATDSTASPVNSKDENSSLPII